MNGSGQVSGTRAMLLTVVVVVAVLHAAQDVFVPLALALLLTFLLAPLVANLQRVGMNRILAVIVSIAIALTLIGAVADVVFSQFGDLARQLPAYRTQLHQNLTHLKGALRGGVVETTNAVEQLTREFQRVAPGATTPSGVSRVQIVKPPTNAVDILRDFIAPLLKPIGTAVVVIVLVAFMLLRLPDLRERVIRLLGSRNLQATTEALNDAARRVSRYLLVQLLINGWTGTWVAIGLWFLDVPNAWLWGVLTMVLRFIPYVGVWTAAAMPLALSFAVFDDWTRSLLVLGWYGVLELFSYSVLEPWLYGNQTGVSPVALLLAAAFWTWLWGIAGLFLAIPLTVCLVVMGKYIPQLEFLQVLLGDEPVLAPPHRLYQRLLASNRDEADTLLEEALRTQPMLDVCDSTILPALRLVETDHDRDALEEGRRRLVLDSLSQWADERLELLGSRPSSPHRPAPAVLCVAAADDADRISAKLLAAVLLERGVPAVFALPDSLESRIGNRRASLDKRGPADKGDATDTWGPADKRAVRQGYAADRNPQAVVVCALPPEAITPARAVCRQVRAAADCLPAQDLPLIVGLWTLEGDLQRPQQRLAAAGATRIVVSFAECIQEIEALNAGAELPVRGEIGAPVES